MMGASSDLPQPKATREKRATPTIYDLARAAGVTIGTASKALNGQGKLRPETRARVRAEAERLGFRPNDLAQSLMRGRSFTVGLLTTDSYGRFSIPLLMGIEDVLGAERISVFLCNGRGDLDRERQYIDTLLAKRVDGIIVTGRRTDPRAPIDIGNAHVPVLYAYAQVDDPNACCLLPDDGHGARLATEHLARLGRRRFAHITGPERFEAVRLRRDAMRGTLTAHGHMLPDDHVLYGPWQERWGFAAANALRGVDPAVDAIFCGSDLIARGVVDCIREQGRRVPADVAVVGFDNWDVIAAEMRPALTSVDMNLHELGLQAGMRLLAMIGDERGDAVQPGIARFPCRLVVRDSCGADRSGDGPSEEESSDK